MATKRKTMIGGGASATSDEHGEKQDQDLNMSDDKEVGTRIGDIYIPPPVKPYCSTENIGPRLIITNISNSNFKIYFCEVVLGPISNVRSYYTCEVSPKKSSEKNRRKIVLVILII